MLRELLRIFLGLVRDVFRGRAELIAENALLRQQVLVLQRGVPRPRLKPRDRWAIAAITRASPVLLDAVAIVHPETVIRWHRSLWRLIWRRKSQRPVGRPPVSPRTVAKYRPPHLPRNRGQRWSTFVRNHLHQTWACDRSELLRRTASPPNFATSFPAVSVSMARRFCHEITAMQLRFPAAAVADRPACFHAFAPLSFDKSCLMLCPPTMPTSPFSVPLPKSWPKHAKAATPHVISFAHFVIIHVRGFAVNSPIHRVRLAAERQGGRAHQHRGAAKL